MGRRGRLMLLAASFASAAGLVAGSAALAQSSSENMLAVRSIDGTDRENVELTFLYTGEPGDLNGLTVREDGENRKITEVTPLAKTDQRLGTVYVVDVSPSMEDQGGLTSVKKGLTEIAESLPAGDEMAIMSFSDAAVVESGFTDSADQLREAIDGLVTPKDGKRATWDAMRKATGLFEAREELQPNLVVVTNGADDASRTTADEARASVVSSGAALFSIEMDNGADTDAAAFKLIMDRTGGAAFPVEQGPATEEAFTDANATLRSQYVVSYPSSVRQGQVDVSLSIGSLERNASYVAGANVQGAAAAEVVPPPEPFGPEWLRGRLGGAVALALVGLAAGLGAWALVSLATKSDDSLNAVLRPYSEGPIIDDQAENALAQTAFLQRAVEMTEDFAERQGFLSKVEHALERADLPLRAAEAMFFYVTGALLTTLLVLVLGGLMPALMIGLLALLLPPAFVNFKASRRAKKFNSSLPDTLQLLSGSLRAGYSLLQGVEAVSQEVEDPMGKELRRVITEARLGREVEDSMDGVAERMASPDFAWAVMAIRIQREVGGNLSELLLTVADTMIERERLRRDIAALTAEGKLSAMILGLLPVGLGAFMWMSNPEYMSPLGSTTLGHVLLGVATVALLIGFAWMKKIINIEI